MDRRAILIAGPTASGKSAIALALAQGLGGVIVNADSMQVYGDLRLLTARPSPADEARARHVLYGHVAADAPYSAGRWLAEARDAAQGIWREGGVPIFTGGTGLYFKVLEEGLAGVPPIPEDIRAQVRALARKDARALRRKAEALGIDAGLDVQRLARAVEVRLATGRRLEDFQAAGQAGVLAGVDVLRLFVAPERGILRARIAERFAWMMRAGAVAEVAALMARGLDADLPVMRAIGVPQIGRALAGDISMEEAVEKSVNATRQYAKRQMTWARKFMKDWHWPSPEEARAEALRLARAKDWC